MKKIVKRLLITGIMIYFVVTLINHQQTLNTDKTAEKAYQEELESAKETKKELEATNESVSSLDYIEEVAREKLDMYLPNERIYVDIDK